MLLDANMRVFTNNKSTLSLESWSTTNFPLQIPTWQKSGINEGVLEGWCVVWFSTFHRKTLYIAKFDVDTSTLSCKDWKELERIQTQR